MRKHPVLCCLIVLAGCGSKTADESVANREYAQRMAQQHAADAPSPSPAAQVERPLPVRSQAVQYAQIGGKPVQGYLAYPAAAEGGLPGVLVFHEWWGLNDNIRAMTDQLAAQGYVALAADLYLGRTADSPERARVLVEEALADPDVMGQNLRSAHAYLKDQVKATRIGTIGWCLGGMLSLRTALLVPDQVDAAVIYYGRVGSDPETLKPLRAPVLGIFGGADAGIPVESVRAFEQALKALGKDVTIHVYEGAEHAFANPSGRSYQPEPAADAWQKALTFLASHLKGG
jgi:carboxymethylenebutenolidase